MGILQRETEKTELFHRGLLYTRGLFQGCKPLCAGQSRLPRWGAQGREKTLAKEKSHPACGQSVTFKDPEPPLSSHNTKTVCLKGQWESELHFLNLFLNHFLFCIVEYLGIVSGEQ